MGIIRGIIGLVILLAIAWLFSRSRRKMNWRVIVWGTLLQVVFALLILKTSPGRSFFEVINDVIVKVLSFTDEGARFLFGSLLDSQSFGVIFAFRVLPTIIFFSAVISILYYLRVMQFVVRVFAKIMMKFMGTSGAETLSCSANIFIGQTEAPLMVRPYIESMTKSELLAVMTGGFATVSGGVMAAYVAMLGDSFPDIAGHLLAASIMSAPAALVMAKIIIPEEEEPKTKGTVKLDLPITDANVIDAAANGAALGAKLALNVGAMLLAFIAIIALLNFCLHLAGNGIGYIFDTDIDLSFQKIFAWLCAPVSWIMGVPWDDCLEIGELIGIKTVVNEFVAYAELGNKIVSGEHVLHAKSVVIATYALCGFSNFSSIAIQIGGIGGIAPTRRSDLARLGLYGLLAGSLACFQTAVIAGMFISSTEMQLPAKPTPSPIPHSYVIPRTENSVGARHAVPLRIKE
jgi:CNT family concentrative nucleoside transporter